MEGKEKKRRPKYLLLCIALVLILLSSVVASGIQSSWGAVDVRKVEVMVEDGYTMTGLVMRPRLATEDNPLPLIICCHGSFNNKEMQDINYVELARRGYVVFAMDSARHGDSSLVWEGGSDYSPENSQNARDYAMRRVLEYCYSNFNFIDKTKIGCMGHSMGGQISDATLRLYLQQEALGEGENKVAAILLVGREPAYDPYEFEGVDGVVMQTADIGIIGGKYDESFFRYEDVEMRADRFAESETAHKFVNHFADNVPLDQPVELGHYYTGEYEGETYKRVIYQSNEHHVLNHFSTETARYTIEYWYEVFGVPNGYEYIAPENQTWLWKEIFNFIGLIGIFLFIVPFATLLMAVPFFKELKTEKVPPARPALKGNGKGKAVYWLIFLVSAAVPALLLFPVELHWIGKDATVPGTVTPWFGQQNTNELAMWSAIVAIALLIIFVAAYLLYGKKNGVTTEMMGFKTKGKAVWKSFLLALCIVTALYFILFFVDFFFLVDFRIWVVAMRVFTASRVPYFFAYAPAFILFYLVNALVIDGGNRIDGWASWKTTLVSIVGNIAGLVVILFIQYGTLIATNHNVFNAMRVYNTYPLVLLIPLATIISRALFRRTGKIYLGGFTMGMYYTIMVCANTQSTLTVLPVI